jgi:hypothetical protein
LLSASRADGNHITAPWFRRNGVARAQRYWYPRTRLLLSSVTLVSLMDRGRHPRSSRQSDLPQPKEGSNVDEKYRSRVDVDGLKMRLCADSTARYTRSGMEHHSTAATSSEFTRATALAVRHRIDLEFVPEQYDLCENIRNHYNYTPSQIPRCCIHSRGMRIDDVVLSLPQICYSRQAHKHLSPAQIH